MHNIKVMVEEIDISMWKLLENTMLNPIVGQIKIRKLLLTRLKIKHNITLLRHHVTQFPTQKKWRYNIPFNYVNKKVLLGLSVLVIYWQEPLVAVKKTLDLCLLM